MFESTREEDCESWSTFYCCGEVINYVLNRRLTFRISLKAIDSTLVSLLRLKCSVLNSRKGRKKIDDLSTQL